jgi:hypothetical protein
MRSSRRVSRRFTLRLAVFRKTLEGCAQRMK